MPVTLELPNEVLAKLRAEADRRGVELGDVIADLVAQLPDGVPTRRKLGFVSLGASTSGRTAREADEMLAEGFGRE